jgi:hypothetical protein
MIIIKSRYYNMKKIFELTFSDRIVITEIKSELSFSVYEAKK